MKKKITLIIILLIFSLISVNATESSNVNYPNRTIELVVPGTVGQDSDISARLYAEELSKLWKVPVIVNVISNTPSAIRLVHEAKPDGYMALMMNDAFFTNVAQRTIDFGIEDMTLLGIVEQSDGQVLVSRSELGWKNLDDLKEACDKEPDTYTVAVAFGATTVVMGKMLVNEGIQCRLVDSSGGADRIASMLGKHIDAAFLVWSSAKEYVENGQWNVLCILNPERSKVAPEIPTAIEQGYNAEFPTRHFIALTGGVNDDIIRTWNEALSSISNNPDFQELMFEKLFATACFIGKEESLRIFNSRQPLLNEILGE